MSPNFQEAVSRYVDWLERVNDYLERQDETINQMLIERAKLIPLEQRIAELATLDEGQRIRITGVYRKNGLLPVEH